MAQESVYYSINKEQGSVAVDYDSTGGSQREIAEKIEILGYPIEHS